MTNPYFVDVDGVLWGPGVTHKFLPENYTQPQINPRVVIMHSNASPRKVSGQNLHDFMARTDIAIECHLIPALDGTVIQCMRLNRRADCNAQANGFAISMETQDNGSPTLADTPWSAPQFEAIAGILAAIASRYNIPLTAPAAWFGAGVGYHSQFSQWSVYVGKACPGAQRIGQMPALRARAAQIMSPLEVPVKVYRKDGKSAVWLSDKVTRQWVPNMTALTILESKYGPTTILASDTNLDTELGLQVLSYTADV